MTISFGGLDDLETCRNLLGRRGRLFDAPDAVAFIPAAQGRIQKLNKGARCGDGAAARALPLREARTAIAVAPPAIRF
jgi:hypothetical protein